MKVTETPNETDEDMSIIVFILLFFYLSSFARKSSINDNKENHESMFFFITGRIDVEQPLNRHENNVSMFNEDQMIEIIR